VPRLKSITQKIWQLGDIRRDPPRLIGGGNSQRRLLILSEQIYYQIAGWQRLINSTIGGGKRRAGIG
jgi:hypothetical protein